ncbi:hypothetical protein HAX54_053055 [Datura stramonium]|uniref:Uncharacterized protein n=1 Tax=Datura stramonium TaxID=4076 RepID=A0ABS8T0M2_DATST|nr:hypothetical protein [Datura stramonium]
MEMEAAGRGEKGDHNNNNNISEEMSITSSVDWRGKPSNPIKHGGMKAAAFVLGYRCEAKHDSHGADQFNQKKIQSNQSNFQDTSMLLILHFQWVLVAFLNKRVSPSDARMLHGIYHQAPLNHQSTIPSPHPVVQLPSIPYIMLIFSPSLRHILFVPFARKIHRHDSGITPLHRIGVGLFFATFSMVSAALIENKRRISAVESNETLSIFWITPQFLIFGISEMFTAVGLIEFFYKQSLKGSMQSFLTAITYCSYSFGFYLSSLLVSLVNKITSNSSHHGGGWLSDNNLNKDRLDRFYWLLAVLSFLNFFNYLIWAKWYSKNGSSSSASAATTNQEFNSKVVGDDGIV